MRCFTDSLHKLLFTILLYISTPYRWLKYQRFIFLSLCLRIDIFILTNQFSILYGIFDNWIHACYLNIYINFEICMDFPKFAIIQRYALVLRILLLFIFLVYLLFLVIRHAWLLCYNSLLLKVFGIVSISLLKVINLMSLIIFAILFVISPIIFLQL